MESMMFPIAVAVVGILAGSAFGLVIKGSRSRRKIESLQSEIKSLKDTLQTHRDGQEAGQISKPQRWTGTEIAAVLAAVGSLVGMFWTNFNSSQQGRLETASREIKRLEDEKEKYRTSVSEQFTRGPEAWEPLQFKDVPSATSRTDLVLDGWRVSADCNNLGRVTLKYDGSAPAVLTCSGKSVTIQLKARTKLMLIPPTKPK